MGGPTPLALPVYSHSTVILLLPHPLHFSCLLCPSLLSPLLTVSVTGWKGLQDQPSGPQGTGDLLGAVAEQGLGRGRQEQLGVLRKALPWASSRQQSCFPPLPWLRFLSMSLVSNKGLAEKGSEHSRPRGARQSASQTQGTMSLMTSVQASGRPGRKVFLSDGTAHLTCSLSQMASRAACNNCDPPIPANLSKGWEKLWGRGWGRGRFRKTG